MLRQDASVRPLISNVSEFDNEASAKCWTPAAINRRYELESNPAFSMKRELFNGSALTAEIVLGEFCRPRNVSFED